MMMNCCSASLNSAAAPLLQLFVVVVILALVAAPAAALGVATGVVVAVEDEESHLLLNNSNNSNSKIIMTKTKTKKFPEAWTLDGIPLYAKTFVGFEKAGLDAQLDIAINNLRKSPPASKKDPTNLVWVGRRLAYKWQYREAISIYTKAIEEHNDDDDDQQKEKNTKKDNSCNNTRYSPLYRHRGHIYISTRNFTKAQLDLEMAANLITDSEDDDSGNGGGGCFQQRDDSWEPDGKPNKYNLPLYSRHYNIYYHLGLSRYLQGNFTGAIQAYDQLMETLLDDDVGDDDGHNENDDYSYHQDNNNNNNNKKRKKNKFRTNDAIASAVYWKYMALRRAGYSDQSLKVNETLSWISSDDQDGMKVLDVETYLEMCYFFKGMKSAPSLQNITDPLDYATLAYGIGNHHYMNGRTKQAIEIWNSVVQNNAYWPAFGFIATEADLYRLKKKKKDHHQQAATIH